MKLPPKITNAKNKKPLPTRKFKNTLGHLLGQRGNKPKSQMVQGRGRKLIDTRNIAIYNNFKWTVICKNIESLCCTHETINTIDKLYFNLNKLWTNKN